MTDYEQGNTAKLENGAKRGLASRFLKNGSVENIVRKMVDAVRLLVGNMLANVDDHFMNIAEKSASAEHHSLWLDSSRRITAQRATICNDFYASMTKSALIVWCEPRPSGQSEYETTTDATANDMSILSEEEAELSVAVSTIISKGELQFGYELGCLTGTLQSLSRSKPLNKSRNPLGMASITSSFIDAIQDLSLDVEILLCLLELFERDVANELGNVYSGVLEQLEKSGITIIKYSTDDKTTLVERSQQESVDDVPNGSIEFSDLQNYLSSSSHRRELGPSTSYGEGVVNANVGQLLETVSLAQDQYLEQLSECSTGTGRAYPSLQSYLLSLPKEQGGFQNAGKAAQDTLQLISDLFEHMFRNENLSLASKALIARLQLPVLKVALLDKSIFNDSEHPSRKLLNRLAIDGIGWPTNTVLLNKNPLYLAAEKLVLRLNKEFTDDIAIFVHLLDEWNKLVSSQRGRTESAERRINETVLGKAKLDAAKCIVQQVMNKRAAGSRLPRIVASFITHEWTTALIVTCINFGTDSEQWRKVCSTFDDLLQACQPAGNSAEAEVSRSSVTRLISQLREGLELSGSIGSVTSETLDEVAESLEKINREDKDWFSGNSKYEVEDIEIIEEIIIVDIDHEVTNEPCLSKLEPGTWIEINRSGMVDPLRCRLVMIIERTQTYVFSDINGLKVCEKSAAELAEGLEVGDVRIIHEELLVERAIDELMAELRSSMRT